MMKSKNLWLYGIIAFTLLFIASSIVFRIFDVEILPSQFFGALIGVVITAIITVFLLLGQTQAEESKERNVKVFEERSTRYQRFIERLLEIWDDRVVDLEELNELIKLVSKDIIPYSKPETVNTILLKLIEIAEHAKPEDVSLKNVETTKRIQGLIFDIINELSKEIGLGGEINTDIRNNLNKLEEKVIPFLIQKDFKKQYIESVQSALENSEEDIDFSSIQYKDKYLWCRIKESDVYIRVGPLEREKEKGVMIGAYVEYGKNRNFQKYRDAARGKRKDYLRGMIAHLGAGELVNFNDYEAVQKLYYQITPQNKGTGSGNDLVEKITQLYKSWKVDGKNIEEIIDACTVKQ